MNLLFPGIFLICIQNLTDVADSAFANFLEILAEPKHECYEKAWREFERRYRTLIFGRIRAVTQNPTQIEEISAQVLKRLLDHNFRALKNFRAKNEEKAFISFLNIVCRRTAIAHMLSLRMSTDAELDDYSSHGFSDETQSLYDHLVEILNDAHTDRQKNDYHQHRDILIFTLRKVAGFRAKEVAALPLLNTTDGNVDNVVNRLSNLIRKNLRDYLG